LRRTPAYQSAIDLRNELEEIKIELESGELTRRADRVGDGDAAPNREGVAATGTRAARVGWIAAAVAGAVVTSLIMWTVRPARPVPAERRAVVPLPDSLVWIP
jgi:hypothetical protein